MEIATGNFAKVFSIKRVYLKKKKRQIIVLGEYHSDIAQTLACHFTASSYRGCNISQHMPHAGANVCPGRSKSQGSATHSASRADEHTGVCVGGEFIAKEEE